MSWLISPHFAFVLVVVFGFLKSGLFATLPHALVKGLRFVIVPSDDEILALPDDTPPKRSKKNDPDSEQELKLRNKKVKKVAKSENLNLRVTQLEQGYLSQLPFYEQYDSLVFVVFVAFSSYLFGEFWSCMTCKQDDLSFLLMFLVLLFCWYLLLKLWWAILSLEDMWLHLGSFALAVGVLSAFFFLPANLFDFDLRSSYAQFLVDFNQLLKNNHLEFEVQVNFSWFMWLLIVSSSFLFSLNLYPAIRFIRCFHSITGQKVRTFGTLTRFACYLNVLFPGLVCLMWVKPLSKDFFVNEQTLITDSGYQSLRMYLLLLCVLFRVFVFRPSVQTFLDSSLVFASQFVSNLTQYSGRILQQSIRYIFQYSLAMMLQYLLPAIQLAVLALLLKRKSTASLGLCELALAEYCTQDAQFNFLNNSLLTALLEFSMFWHTFSWFVQSVFALVYVRSSES